MVPAPAKRPYLRASERRRQLLDATGRLFDHYGFGGITMAGLATEAGVSRQLVYSHFADVDSLYVAFVQDRLAGYRDKVPDITSLRLGAAARTMFRHLLAIPSTDRRLIRLLVADVGIRALDRVRKRFLADELARWDNLAAPGTGVAVVWATTSALLALADAVDAHDIDAATATEIAVRMIRAAAHS